MINILLPEHTFSFLRRELDIMLLAHQIKTWWIWSLILVADSLGKEIREAINETKQQRLRLTRTWSSQSSAILMISHTKIFDGFGSQKFILNEFVLAVRDWGVIPKVSSECIDVQSKTCNWKLIAWILSSFKTHSTFSNFLCHPEESIVENKIVNRRQNVWVFVIKQ